VSACGVPAGLRRQTLRLKLSTWAAQTGVQEVSPHCSVLKAQVIPDSESTLLSVSFWYILTKP